MVKCEVRNSSKFSPTGIEIMVGRKCHIVRTDSKFDVHHPDSAAMKVVDVQKVACFQRLSLIVKAVQVGDVATVGSASKRKPRCADLRQHWDNEAYDMGG